MRVMVEHPGRHSAKSQLPAQYAGAAIWAGQKLSHEPDSLASIYTMRSEWPAVRAAAGAPGSRPSLVRWPRTFTGLVMLL